MSRPNTGHSKTIAQAIRKQLLPRIDQLKEMVNEGQVPDTCDQQVIIPCLQNTLGFKTNQYFINKSFLDGYIAKVDFNSFVRKCNIIVEQQVIFKSKKENQQFFGIISTLLKISIVIAILTFFLLSTIVFFQIEESTSDTILIVAGLFLASAALIAVVCPVILYSRKYQTYNQELAIQNRLKKLVQQQNHALIQYGQDHLKWKIQEKFFWIKLSIDRKLFQMKSENQISEQSEMPEPIIIDDMSDGSANQLVKQKAVLKTKLNSRR